MRALLKQEIGKKSKEEKQCYPLIISVDHITSTSCLEEWREDSFRGGCYLFDMVMLLCLGNGYFGIIKDLMIQNYGYCYCYYYY